MVTLKRNEFTVAIATLILLVYTLTLSVVSQVASQSLIDRTIGNKGSVKAIGVGVYWDENCTNEVSFIDWGVIEPGFSENVTVYIRNEGNSLTSLSMETTNWNPSNASQFITLNWDYNGQQINPNEVIKVTFTLSVSASIEGITSFSFDLVIVGSG
jgi:hypothetical protein